MSKYLPYVTTPDGRNWSAEAVSDLVSTRDSIMGQRDRVQLELDLLRGKIHLLDLAQIPGR